MEGYVDFNILMHRLVAGFDYDISQIKGPSKIIIPPSKKDDKKAELKPEEIKDYKEQFTFSQDNFAITWLYNDDHKARTQSLHVKNRDKDGIEKLVCLEESDHTTKMFAKIGEQKYEEILIASFEVRDLYEQIRGILYSLAKPL